ncbi:MAG TPA: outer membrane beta-barrel protein [Flavobacteriales bacterium]|nr:outer membrane beta-barrel protein [Flavobacteriales bacterium]
MRSTITSLAFIAAATFSHAQIELRPHIGTNIQNLTESPDGTEWTGNPGFQAGLHVMIGNQFFVQPGIQYVSSKSDLTSTIGGTDASFTLSTGTLRVPAVVGYRFSDPSSEPTLNLRIFGGLGMNFPMNATFNEDGVEDVEVGSANFALTAGAGLDISIFFVEAGYDIGMTNVFDDEDFDVDAKQNQFQLNAGVRLKFAQ